jgi:hypothetical protein
VRTISSRREESVAGDHGRAIKRTLQRLVLPGETDMKCVPFVNSALVEDWGRLVVEGRGPGK